MSQAEGMRVISFRHEQNAGNAAAAAGFLTQKPGICLTVSAPGFLNGLTALANATTNCFPMILISGSSEREIVDLQQGDYEEMDQLAIAKPLCKAAFRVLHAEDIGVGIARAIRAAVSGRPGGVYLDLPAKLFPQTMDAEAGKQLADQGRRSGAAPDPRAGRREARARPAQGRQAPADHSRQGRGVRAGRRRHPRVGREDRHPLPADVDGQGPAARHPCAVRFGGALVRAGRGRRRDAGRRAPELAAVARQGQDLGRGGAKEWGGTEVRPDRHLADGGRQQRGIDAPVVGDIGSCVSALLAAIGADWAKPAAEWIGAIAERKDKNVAKMAETLAKNPSPMNFHSALNVVRDIVKARPDAILVNEGANTLDFTRSIVDMYKPRKRLDVGTWGIMGIGMGFAVAAAVVSGEQVIAVEGDSAFGFSGMEVETICRYNLPVCVVIFNNNGVYRGNEENQSGGRDIGPPVFVKDARYEKMMEAFGGVGVLATTPAELRKAMEEAIASGKPTLINAVIDENAGTESGRITSLNPSRRRRSESLLPPRGKVMGNPGRPHCPPREHERRFRV